MKKVSFEKIVSIKPIGIKPTIDLEVNHSDHNFYAEGIVVSNSHSVAYATMSFQTAYLKFKYPKFFFLSLLKLAKDEQNPVEEVSKIQSEMKNFGINLLPPDLLKSQLEFSIEGDNIRMGIGNIKGIADKTLEKLKLFIKEYDSKFHIFNAANECKIGIGILSSLIQSGCLDSAFKNETRTKMVLEAQLFNLLTDKEKRRVCEISAAHNDDLIEIIKTMTKPNPLSKDSKPFIKPSRAQTIREKFKGYHEIYKQNSKNEDLASYFYEMAKLGYSYSNSLFNIIKKEYPDLISIEQCKGELNETKVLVCGQITEFSRGVSKKKNAFCRFTISDGTSEFKLLLMEKKFGYCNELNNGHEFEVGNIVVCEGKKASDIIHCDKVAIQDVLICTKLSDLKS